MTPITSRWTRRSSTLFSTSCRRTPEMSEKVLLARVGRGNSRSIETYLEDGGYTALRTVLTGGWTPEKLTDEVKKAGLRGPGGAGVPTGGKWTFVPKDIGRAAWRG